MALKLRLLTKFPALVQAATGLAVERLGRVYTFMLDWMAIAEVDGIPDPTSRFVVVVSGTPDTQLYERIAIDDFTASLSGNVQEITTGGPHNIEATAAIVLVNQTVGAAITLMLPLSAAKVGPVKVVDMKGDAATNNITIVPSGSEKYQAGITSWVIGSDAASAVFSPIPGTGYAV
jgi:hypothetical protein